MISWRRGGGACQATVGPLKIRFLAQKTRIYAIKYSALLRCATQKLIWQRKATAFNVWKAGCVCGLPSGQGEIYFGPFSKTLIFWVIISVNTFYIKTYGEIPEFEDELPLQNNWMTI
jgi:hypothetical protein